MAIDHAPHPFVLGIFDGTCGSTVHGARCGRPLEEHRALPVPVTEDDIVRREYIEEKAVRDRSRCAPWCGKSYQDPGVPCLMMAREGTLEHAAGFGWLNGNFPGTVWCSACCRDQRFPPMHRDWAERFAFEFTRNLTYGGDALRRDAERLIRGVLFHLIQVADTEMADQGVDGTAARYVIATLRALGAAERTE